MGEIVLYIGNMQVKYPEPYCCTRTVLSRSLHPIDWVPVFASPVCAYVLTKILLNVHMHTFVTVWIFRLWTSVSGTTCHGSWRQLYLSTPHPHFHGRGAKYNAYDSISIDSLYVHTYSALPYNSTPSLYVG